MPATSFLDTNILIYSVDAAFPDKRAKAVEIIADHLKAGTGVISTQVLQEFYSAATKKLKIDPLAAKQHIKDFQHFDVVQVTPQMIETAIDHNILSQISFWDALVCTAASTANCHQLVSEELNDGQVIAGVKIHNPFK